MKKKTYFELEAGSITTKKENDLVKFLVIYRKKMNDYALPQRSCWKKESLEDAAIRETEEETGYEIKIVEYIDSFEYKVGEEVYIVRRVYNFLGEVIGGESNGKNIDLNEGDMEVMRLSYKDALEKLTYENNRDFVKKTYKILENRNFSDFNIFSHEKYHEIVNRIKESDFYNDVLKVWLLGSTNDNEAINSWSDLDILFILKSDKVGNINSDTIIKMRNFNKKINYLYPNLNISFLTHTYNDLKNYVSYAYLETYQFATFLVENDDINFAEFISDIIKSRNISEDIKKRYAVYYLRHLRFNLLRKVVSEDLFDNKKALKRIIDEIISVMTIISSYYNFRTKGKNNILQELKTMINDNLILNIFSKALEERSTWPSKNNVTNDELLLWIKNLNKIESFILKNNMYSTPEELMNK